MHLCNPTLNPAPSADGNDGDDARRRLCELERDLRGARERALKGRFPLVRGVTQITLPDSALAEFKTPYASLPPSRRRRGKPFESV